MATNVQELLAGLLRDQDTRGVNADLLAKEIMGTFIDRGLVVAEAAYVDALRNQLAACRAPMIEIARMSDEAVDKIHRLRPL